MPTPSPIIETRIGVTVLMSVCPARMKSRRNAVARAVMATRIGISMAVNVPKTISSTMIAARMPSSSGSPCLSGGCSASPLYSTVTPTGAIAWRTKSSTSTTCCRCAWVISLLKYASE